MSTINDLWVVGQDFQRPTSDVTAWNAVGTVMLDALLAGRWDEVQALLMAGVPIGLREAALLDDVERIRRLIDLGVDPIPERGWSPLHLAAWSGHVRSVEALLSYHVPVDLPMRLPDSLRGCTSLHLAVVNSRRAVVEHLLEAGADPRRRDDAGWTPLHQAAWAGDLALVKPLLVAGAEVNALCGDTTPLGLAQRQGHQHVVSMLRQVGGTD